MDAHPNFERAYSFNHTKSNKDEKFVKKGSSEIIKKVTESRTGQKTSELKNDDTRKIIKCFKCGKLGHKSFNCRSTQGFTVRNDYKREHNANNAVACQIELKHDENGENSPIFVAAVDSEIYLQDLKYPFKG